MASEQSGSARQFELGIGMLRQDEVSSDGLPVTRRGYDRGYVDRLLQRTADAYGMSLKKNQSQRERLLALEAELAAAEGEAAASARAVAELMQKAPAADQVMQLQDLEARLERAEYERDNALAAVREATERASALARQVEAHEHEQRTRAQQETLTQPVVESPLGTESEAAGLLLAAARAAEDVRIASRARALRTLTKARELAALVDAQTERERTALEQSLEHRAQVESEAEELLAEAQRVVSEVAERREQMDREAEERLAEVRRIEAEAQERRAWADREVEERLSEARRVDTEIKERHEHAARDVEERLAEVRRIAAETQERRAQVEREAEETLAQAHAEADRLVAGIEEERTRMRDILSDALALLATETTQGEDAQQEDLVDDLSSRLHESPEARTGHGG